MSDQPAGTPRIETTGFAHVRLTVTDLERSKAFYDSVFGWPLAYAVPPGADEATRESLAFLFGGVIYAVPGGLLGLRPVAPGSDTFTEDRVGLDHLALTVASVRALHDAASTLDALGIAHEPVKDLGELSILEFRDPDGIALELAAAH